LEEKRKGIQKTHLINKLGQIPSVGGKGWGSDTKDIVISDSLYIQLQVLCYM
jgi:hypothetical protein